MTARAKMRRRGVSNEVVDIPTEFGPIVRRLIEAREEAGVSISDAGTSRWERGVRLRGATALEFVRVAEKLGVRVGWLIRGEQPMRNTSRLDDATAIRAEEVEEEP